MASCPALDLRFAPGPGAGTLQDMLYAELDAFEPLAIQEHESGDGWRVFFRTRGQRDRARRALAAEFENALDLTAVDVDDEDWARRSQESLKAARVGRIVVAPPWDVPRNRDRRQATSDIDAQSENATGDVAVPASRQRPGASRDTIVIVIDPSTGFGTGHHATTRLCLELLQQLDLEGKRVIDVGTGSGVLAIAAAKFGAADVVALDNDPDALRNARENAARNRVAIDVIERDLSNLEVAAADVVLANLTAAVLQRLAERLVSLVKAGGTLVVSGFSPEDAEGVRHALGRRSATIVRDGEWAALRITRSESRR